MRYIITVAVLFVLLIRTASGQPPGNPQVLHQGVEGERPSFIFFEALNFVSPDTALSRVDIHYRIDTDFLIPVKNADQSFPWEFKRRGELLIELVDSTDVSKARDIHRFELGTHTTEQSDETREWYQGVVSFNVAPGLYRVMVEIDDLESERKVVDRQTLIRARRLLSSPLDHSTPLFVQWDDTISSRSTIIPQNFGGDLLFGKKSGVFVELPSGQATVVPSAIRYTISTVPTDDERSEVVLADTVTNARIIRGIALEPTSRENSASYTIDSNRVTGVTGLLIPLGSESLPLRALTLSLSLLFGSSETTITKPFRTVWPDMPFSLRDVDYALNALRYITTEQQLDSLKRGSFKERRNNLEAFWKGKDPTPSTSYNELMVQYYRRVDYAAKHFGTLREPDGSRSDRGRIHILFGPPTRIDRTLNVTMEFQEIWYFERLNKKFIFLDQNKSGTYVLVSTQSL